MEKTTDKGLSRRTMMLVAGGAVAGAGALLAAPFREEITSKARELVASTKLGRGLLSLADAGYEEWAAQVGAVFALGGSARIELVGVRALPTSGVRPRGLRTQAFAAIFDPLGRQPVVGDQIHTAVHSEYGPLPLFLSATSDPRTPNRVVAVFN